MNADKIIDFIPAEKERLGLPAFFTLVYFADISTSIIGAAIVGGFPTTNYLFTAWVNTIIIWVIFKVLVYMIILLVYRYFSKYSSIAENVLTSITIIYALMIVDCLASISLQLPVFNIPQDFYNSIEMNRIDVTP